MPSFVVSVEALNAAPGRNAEEELLLALLSFDVLRIALYEASPEGPGSALRPVGVVFSASDFFGFYGLGLGLGILHLSVGCSLLCSEGNITQ